MIQRIASFWESLHQADPRPLQINLSIQIDFQSAAALILIGWLIGWPMLWAIAALIF